MSDQDSAIRARLSKRQDGYRVPEHAAIRAVLDLHKPYQFYEDTQDSCAHCCDTDGDVVAYPCPTVRAIARALGVPDQNGDGQHA